MNTNQAIAEIQAANGEGLQDAHLTGANLQGAYLQVANLRGANLEGANLRGADLRGADLRGADLSEADLSEADLRGADLREANLCWSDLRGADLRGADLRGADLSEADLSEADLRGADLREANLCWSDLRGADLRGADLRGANLEWATLCGAKGLDPRIADRLFTPPQSGAFTAYKKCCDGVIVTLEIPADAKRSSATTRKCRAEKAVVTAIGDGSTEAVSLYDSEFIYRLGETVECDSWEDDRWVECGGGIHFYMTTGEAEAHR